MTIAIRADSLSKAYRIDHQEQVRYRTVRESLSSLARHPLRWRNQQTHETIWALTNISFELERGEALGIVGRNGAGKSTLLKVLSRVTLPTAGRAEVFGRLSSLLEVGTGFHPELTGRENIFLNGAILGMSRRDIRRRFDEIVDFAETERFLDTPVKRYSSGMYMRLAFSVAAHLETDVLVVDEVLAVGDTLFQQKCLGKMEDVAEGGRTVVFVSHNLSAISQLCSTAILLEGGQVAEMGHTDRVIARYSAGQDQAARVELGERFNSEPGAGGRFVWAELRDASGVIAQDFSIGDSIHLSFGMRLAAHRPRTRLAITIRAADGLPIALVADQDSGFTAPNGHDEILVDVRFDDVRLYPGSYILSLWVSNWANTEVFDHAEDCLTFRIRDGGRLTSRHLPRHSGLLFLTPSWKEREARAATAHDI